MSFFDDLVNVGVTALTGGTIAAPDKGSGGQSLADAYKGDGPLGIGELLKGIATAYLQETQGVDETIDKLRALDKQKLDGLIDHLLADYLTGQYHKDVARADAREARDNNYKAYADQFIPKLHGLACSNGIWNSTALQLMANDAYASTVIKSAEMELNNIKEYGKLHLEEAQTIDRAISTLVNSYQDTKRKQTLERNPDVGEFAKDFAIVQTALGILNLFGKRQYFADKISNGTEPDAWGWLPSPGTPLSG